MLSIKRDTEQWGSSITVAAPPAPAQFHVVAIPSIADAAVTSRSDIMEQFLADLTANILRNRENPEYGFSLGTADLWFPILSAYPEYRHPLRSMLKS